MPWSRPTDEIAAKCLDVAFSGAQPATLPGSGASARIAMLPWSRVCSTRKAIPSNIHIQTLAGVAIALACSSAVTADPKRDLPDYDGRGNTDADDDGSWALWIPRAVLSPLHFVSDSLIRRPLGALVSFAERHHWVSAVEGFLTFGARGNYMVVPTALFDFGLLPSAGVYFAGDAVGTAGNAIRVHAATWGPDWINATALDRLTWNGGATALAARVEFRRAADLLFFGAGPDATSVTRARYGLQRFDAGLMFDHRFAGESALAISSGVRAIAYRAGNCCGDPSLDARIADGSLAMPAGYGTNYTALYQRAELALDTRAPRPASGTGGYAQSHAEIDVDVRNDRSWISYGAIVGAALDLRDQQRTVKLQLAADFVDPLRGETVPFNELASLGGGLMPGFVAGWMTGRSTAAAQLGYTWPVWMWLDGQARFSIGNAFDRHLGELAVDKLRLSADLGLTSIGKRDQGFELLVGVGTETLEHGAGITSVRLSVGSRKGF
jgi:hypothetical protein